MWSIVFPGQGSQHVGMGRFFFDNFKETHALFEEASDILKTDFKKLCFDGPESELTLTENTQPALVLMAAVYMKAVSQIVPIKPVCVGGHSLGEYSALWYTHALTFNETLSAVRLRGQFMQKAVPIGVGGMLAIIGLEDEEVARLCRWAETESGVSPLEPANYNAPGQVVVSGSQKLIEWTQKNFSPESSGIGKRARLIPLKVSAPFHCRLMKPAQEKMSSVLNGMKWSNADIPVVQNVTAVETTKSTLLKENLLSQISAPVRWSQSVKKMKDLGVCKLLEAGPSNVLAGLAKKIDMELVTFNIQDLSDLKALEYDFEEVTL